MLGAACGLGLISVVGRDCHHYCDDHFITGGGGGGDVMCPMDTCSTEIVLLLYLGGQRP
jgi:hypothetical protein